MDIGNLIDKLIDGLIDDLSLAVDKGTMDTNEMESDRFSHQGDAYDAGVFDAWWAVKAFLLDLK